MPENPTPRSPPAPTHHGSVAGILIVTPAPPGSRAGNRITALRWAAILRSLGHRVRVREQYDGRDFDLLVALHARRSHAAIDRARRERPGRPIVLALTGTDLHGDIHHDADAQDSLRRVDRIVVLQPLGLEQLPVAARAKTRAIVQSACPPPRVVPAPPGRLRVISLAHLRPVKDPFCLADAVRALDAGSRIDVLHFGAALDAEHEARAVRESADNPRWRWMGPRPRGEALAVLAGAWLAVVGSRSEGGANVVSEAIVCGVPVISSRIDGSIGLLGADYPGLFPAGDAAALRAMLARAETDPSFYAGLRARCERLRPEVDPARERAAWAALLADFPGIE